MAKKKRQTKQGFEDFLWRRKLAACVVCRTVPQELQAQIKTASRGQRATIDVGLQWLREQHGIVVTKAQWNAHARGGHGSHA